MADTVQWPPVLGFYLLYLAGLSFFVIWPAIRAGKPMRALLQGAFFGLVTYGTYDFTNWAILSGWTALVSYVDMAWGAFASGLVSFVVARVGVRRP